MGPEAGATGGGRGASDQAPNAPLAPRPPCSAKPCFATQGEAESPPPIEFLTGSPAETEALGERLGRLLSGGEVIALAGPLGAGKTVFVRGLARALGVSPGEVASPTYVLERVHPGRLLLRHLDAYRLAGAEEFEASDLGAGLGAAGTVAVVEWADRVAGAMPVGRIEIVIEVLAEDSRRLRFSVGSESGRRLLELLGRGRRPEAEG